MKTVEELKNFFKTCKTYALKKCVAVLLILFGMVFVLVNRDVYYSKHVESVHLDEEIQSDIGLVSFQGDGVFEQQFQGWNGTLRKVSLRFDNQGMHAATGLVTLHILDSEGNILQSAELPLTSIRTSYKTTFNFGEPQELSKKQTYTLQVVVKDAKNPQGFGVYTYAEKGELFGDLTYNGAPESGRLRATFTYRYYNAKAVGFMFILFILALIFICIPFKKVDKLIADKTGKKIDTNILISRILFFATPVLCVLLQDRINGYHLSQMVRRLFTVQCLFNLFIYATFLLVIYLITNRTQYTSMIVLTLAFLADIANYYVWLFRGCPILATDILSAKTALNVADNFSYTLDITGVWGVVYVITFLAVITSLKGYKGLPLKKRGLLVIACAGTFYAFNTTYFHSDILRRNGITYGAWNPQGTYAKNGTALSFVLSLASTIVEKPSDYSPEKAQEIMAAYPSDSVSDSEGEGTKPNIIAIMNEALADLNYNCELPTSEDYLPFLHSLEENTVKGKLQVSIVGSNTANSEFEFLTGDSMAFLPYRCIPYNLYINDTTPSLTHTVKAQGYTGLNAYHPFRGDGWNRPAVYPLLGFENFYDRDYYNENGNGNLVRNYISDEANFNQIIEDYEKSRKDSDDPFYLFNVTMQNHGSYNGKRGLVDPEITIQEETLNFEEAEQYINLAKKSDDAFKTLVNYFKKVDEPTLIVMFGDHQPPITTDFYDTQFGKSVNDLTPEEKTNYYSTPYVIWANYDIEEAELDMSANYLSSYVANLAGLQLTGYNKYLLDLQKTIPIISAACYTDKDGNVYNLDEKSKYSDLIEEYQIVQYNQLFDVKNRHDEFFFLTEN